MPLKAVLLGTLASLLLPSSVGVLPRPVYGTYGERGPSHCTFAVDPGASGYRRELQAFREDWPALQSKSGRKVAIVLDRSLAEEEYRVSLGASATIRAGSRGAVAWGLGTLGQVGSQGFRQAEVRDKPAYPFRGVAVDVARRFHSLSTLRQIVRWCHAGKVRYVQLHLTDDQNWMLPTQALAGADRNNASGHPAYTREEMRGLQEFAEGRGVSIIPEIDVPGHSALLVRLDPQRFALKGSASTNCVNFGSPWVRDKMRAVVREMAATFPRAPYLHIGGDEAWYPDAEKDPDVAEAMKGGKAPQDVFVDFVVGMAEAVVAEGRTPMVWEGFGPSAYAKKQIPRKAVVVAWEGAYYPAKDLVKDGFRVVNAGWDPCYVVNHYPYDAYTLVPLPNLYRVEPRTFGIVNWAPGTSGSVGLSPAGNLMGSMLCWWEGREWNAQATLPLRILALGSRLWNPAGERDYEGFLRRGETVVQRLQGPFKVVVEGARRENGREFTNRATVRAKAADPSLVFGMRSDGEVPRATDVVGSLEVRESAVVTVQAFRGRVPVGETRFLDLRKVKVLDNLLLHASAKGSTPEDPQFPASRVADGVADNVGSFWLGYPIPCSLTLDMGRAKRLNRIDVVPFWAAGQATRYAVDLSLDGKSWAPVADATGRAERPTEAGYVHRFPAQGARYVRVRITGSEQFPPTMARIHEVRAFLADR